jgi:hypothetical protein
MLKVSGFVSCAERIRLFDIVMPERKGFAMLRYSGALIAVQDMAVSRRFYEDLLGQQVKFDFGRCRFRR